MKTLLVLGVCTAVVFTVFCLSHLFVAMEEDSKRIANDDQRIAKMYADEISVCTSKGGVPIRSSWDHRKMTNCVFPGK